MVEVLVTAVIVFVMLAFVVACLVEPHGTFELLCSAVERVARTGASRS